MNSNGIIDLRKRLSKNLKRLIGNPVIEAKELAAFDLIMNRRQFLKAAQFTAIGALVASACPPTAWGRHDRKLHVNPRDVGLTAEEQASVTAAAGLSAGTELFQETIYAQQVVSPEAVGTHALIEGRSSRLRAQSVLDDNDPLESQFLDIDYHFGPPELVQLEKVGNGWELVHYYHSGAARSDGAKTDGLVRHVIIEGASLVNPTKVLTITGTNSNRFGANENSQSSQVAYVVFVEDPTTSPNNFGGLVAVGRVSVRIDPPYTATADASPYPLDWGVMPLNEFLGDRVVNASDIPEYQSCGTYTRNAYQDSATYDAAQATEHIVLYYADTSSVVRPIQILSLIDIPAAGTAIAEAGNVGLKFSGLPLPTVTAKATGPWRVINIDWDPTNPDGDEYYRFTDVTVATTYYEDNGDPVLVAETITPSGADIPAAGPISTLQGASYWLVVYDDAGNKYLGIQPSLVEVSGSGVDQFDFSTIGNVNTLFSETGNNPYYETPGVTAPYRVVLASFASAGLAMFVLGPSEYTDTSDVTYAVQALFPVALPDAAGVGTITNVAGGTSKFGGLRFVASDEDGNVFLLRQQRAQGTDTPYPPPVYGPFDSSGMARTDWNTTGYDSLPSSTSSASPLNDLATWTLSFNAPSYAPPYVAYNMLLSALVGFGTTSSNETQGTWLGNNYQAAYALSRFGYDSVHVVVKAAQGGTPGSYAAYTMFCNPLTRTWHQRMIAQQVTPQPPGENESGDHFQATVTPVNAYGEPVSMTAAENAGLNIEVRADVPTMVVDDTHNLYYNIDQYSSFMAAPDPSTGNLALVVKAETFAQVLYVRLVETSALTPSGGDSALLKSITETIFPWVTINMAAQAQARMGNTKDSTATGTDGQTPDTTVYVSGDSLTASNSQTPWSFKGSYSPSQSNMGDLGSYLNTSGQNMLLVTSQTTGTTADGDPVNPLTTLTAVSTVSLTPGTTSFGYADGTITHNTSAPAPGNVLGGIWSGINHALHDALQWLQHVEGEVYKELASDGVTLAIAVDNITVTVSKDIMKQVNGLEEDLEQVVTTVEEYANVVVNVLVSIVEDSFLYQFIELLIALISLFLYFGDILDLSKSLKSLIKGLPATTSTYPLAPVDTGYPWQDKLTGYVGSPNSVVTDTSQANTDAVVDEVVDGLLNAVSKNPLTKKLLDKVVSAISRAISASDPSSPVQFNMDTSIVNEQIQLFEDFSNDVDNLFVNVTDDVVNSMVNQVVADIENPPQTYTNFTSALGQLMAQVETDAMDSVYTALGQLVATDTSLIDDIMTQSDFLELHIPLLADLFQLFGIGDVSGNNVKVNSGDAISFPLALVIWTAIYTATGKSIDDIGNLIPSSPSALAAPLSGTSNDDLLTFSYSVVAAVLMTINGAIWSYMQTEAPSQRTTGPLRSLNLLGELANLGRWTMGTVKTAIEWDTQQVSVNWTKGYLPVFTFCRTITAITSFGAKFLSITNVLFAITALNAFLNLVAIAWSVADGVTNDTSGNEQLGEENWAILVGDDIGRGAAFFKLVYAWKFGTDETYAQGEDSLELFSACVTLLPFGGFGAAAAATGVQKLNATAPPDAIKQLLYQVDALNIKLPKRAKYRLKTRLIRDLRRALLAYTQGDLQKSVFYLVKARRTVESLKYGRRITSSVADILITQIQNILAYIGVKGRKISKGGHSLIDSRAYNRRRRPSYRGRQIGRYR